MRNLRLPPQFVVMLLLAGIMAGQLPLSYADSGIQIVVNGRPVSTDTAPIIIQGHVLAPMMAIFEALGGTVAWNGAKQTVSGEKDGTRVELSIGNEQATVNGNPITMDVPAMIINGRTMVPVRFVSESLGATVSWDSSTDTVTISLPQTSQAAGMITTVPGTWTPNCPTSSSPAANDNPGGPPGLITDLATNVAIDNDGNLYIAGVKDSNIGIIRKVDQNGIMTTIAGNGTDEYSGDGVPAAKAGIAALGGIAIDNAGNLYLSDAGYDCIRKIDVNGIITTVAGIGTPGYSVNGGPATSAELEWPVGLTTDKAGNIYFADVLNECVRKVNRSGIISTVAGSGPDRRGYWGDGGPAAAAELDNPESAAVDSTGDLYIADTGNNCIRKVDPNGIITTVAGNGTPGYTGDGGLATGAELNGPTDLALDSTGNLYIADAGNDCIRKIAGVGMEIPSNKPDQSPKTASTATDLYSWNPIYVLTFNNHQYTVSTSTVNENEIGSYLTTIAYYGNDPGAFRLYTITKFPNYEEIAVQTKSGYLLAVEGSQVPTTW